MLLQKLVVRRRETPRSYALVNDVPRNNTALTSIDVSVFPRTSTLVTALIGLRDLERLRPGPARMVMREAKPGYT
jgi:hypothetical protein